MSNVLSFAIFLLLFLRTIRYQSSVYPNREVIAQSGAGSARRRRPPLLLCTVGKPFANIPAEPAGKISASHPPAVLLISLPEQIFLPKRPPGWTSRARQGKIEFGGYHSEEES